MVDVAFDAVKLVVNYIREEARLQGRAGDDVRFIMDEMESMNNLLHQLVSTTKPNHDPAGGGDYSHLRTWMKQLLELAFDSRNSVELYMQSAGDSHCCRLPWAMVARHRVVSRIRELEERAREISERQMRYGGGGLLPAQRRDGDTEGGAVDLPAVSSQRQRPRGHASSSSLVRRAILDREFVDNSSVDEALLRLNFLRLKKKKKGADQQSQQQQQVVSDDDDDGNGSGGDDESTDDDLGSDAGDKQQQQESHAGDKQQQQESLSDAGDKQQQQSDAGDKQQAHQPQLDVSDKKQLQSDKLQQEEKQSTQQTQLDGSDKKQQQDDMMQQKLQGIRVVAILVQGATDEAAVGETVLKRYNGFKDTNKLVRRWRYRKRAALHVSVRRPPVLPEIKVQIANQAKKHKRPMGRRYYSQEPVHVVGDDDEFKDEKQAEDFMRKNYASLERLLLVLSGLSCPEILDGIKRFLCGLRTTSANGGGRSLKFAIALCTNDSDAAKVCSSAATDKEPPITYSLVDIYLKRALALLPSSYEDHISATVRDILDKCSPDEDCMKLVLHALYYNPDMTKTETVERLKKSLDSTSDHQERENRIITLCYQTLPNDSKNCLWYSAVFTRGINTPGGVRRASLLRRWIAQGLITQEDEANHCFDAMVEQKLINSHQVSGMGKVKSCAVHTLVHDLIQRESPTVEDLLLNNQLPIENLDLLYSIRIGMQLHPSTSSIKKLFNSVSSKSMLLLSVLDLEGRSDLKPKDLCTICKIRKLKYLSLRNTNVAHLSVVRSKFKRHLEHSWWPWWL